MKKPDFFILGAPKCGTTSLADWLRGHPAVFVSTPKEPHYFNTDSGHRGYLRLDAYERLFAAAGPAHLAVGEASVWYLVSETAVDNILHYQPSARFIVCIRNPIEMAVSLHDQKRFSGDEPIAEFFDAWRSAPGRRNGSQPLPLTCMDPRHVAYDESCLLGAQLARLFETVARDKVMVVVMDDMKLDPVGTYRSVLQFLGVPDDGRVSFEPSNPAKQQRILWLRKLLRVVHVLKVKAEVGAGTGLGALLNRWNAVERPRPPLEDAVLAELRAYFREDVQLLGTLLGRDFSHWLR